MFSFECPVFILSVLVKSGPWTYVVDDFCFTWYWLILINGWLSLVFVFIMEKVTKEIFKRQTVFIVNSDDI